MLSKLMMLAAILAMVLMACVPAMAQSTSVSNSGDYGEVCVPSQQINNEGDVEENSPSSEQQYSIMDDFEAGGTTLNFEPGQENSCDQSVQQSSNASS
jgi:hypothetical protein